MNDSEDSEMIIGIGTTYSGKVTLGWTSTDIGPFDRFWQAFTQDWDEEDFKRWEEIVDEPYG